MIKDFITGITKYIEAIAITRQLGLYRYFVYSGLIGLTILGILAIVAYSFSAGLSQLFVSWIPWDFDYLDSVMKWVTGGLVTLVFFTLYKYLVLIVTAPIMSSLSWQVEKGLLNIEGVDESTKVSSILAEIGRSVTISLRNIVRELFYTVLLLAASLIPGAAIITSPVMILMQGYFAGFSNHDLWAERHLSYRDTIRYMSTHKSMVSSNGVVFLFLIAIPIVGVFIGPPLATIAATSHAVDAYIDDGVV